MSLVDLPNQELLQQQAAWLAPARSRLLRRAAIAHRRRVLELGAGRGAVTGELVRRAGGFVVAVDRRVSPLREPRDFASARRAGGDATRLPFAAATFELVFSELTLLWVQPLAEAVAEIRRVLARDGVFLAVEPDYGGMIEYPPELATQQLWLAALTRAGADPRVGRKLPGLLKSQGFAVRVDLFDRLVPPDSARFALLRGLPLTPRERETLAQLENRAAQETPVSHLPFFLITAR